MYKNKNLKEISATYKMLKKKFKKNQNLQLFLKKKKFTELEKIKMSYDVQSGSYLKFAKKTSKNKVKNVYYPLVKNIKKEFTKFETILDFGCGELNTSYYIFNYLNHKKLKYFANDISLNRLFVGQKFLKEKLKKKNFNKFNLFCNSNFNLPFKNNSIDLVLTVHALESNNNNKKKLINELLRVCRKGVIFMEPDYENSNKEQKKRMNKFNYIRGIKKLINNKKFSLKIIQKIHHMNKQNKSSIFIIKRKQTLNYRSSANFVDPQTHEKLKLISNFLYNKNNFRVFPVINNINLFSDDTQIFLPSNEAIT